MNSKCKWSQQALRVMELARAEAFSYGDEKVEAFHILLGLLSSNGSLDKMLYGIGFRYKEIAKEAMSRYSKDRLSPCRSLLLNNPIVGLDLISQVEELALKLRHNRVLEDHVFIALVYDDGFTGTLMRGFGLSVAKIKDMALEHMAGCQERLAHALHSSGLKSLPNGYDLIGENGHFFIEFENVIIGRVEDSKKIVLIFESKKSIDFLWNILDLAAHLRVTGIECEREISLTGNLEDSKFNEFLDGMIEQKVEALTVACV